MSLTDRAVKNTKPDPSKSKRLFDAKGMYLEVAPAGGTWWRFKYRFAGKEKRLSLGVYPDLSLKDARTKRDKLRELIATGTDPGVDRKAVKRMTKLAPQTPSRPSAVNGGKPSTGHGRRAMRTPRCLAWKGSYSPTLARAP